MLKADDTKSLWESAVTNRWIVTRSERKQHHLCKSNLLQLRRPDDPLTEAALLPPTSIFYFSGLHQQWQAVCLHLQQRIFLPH